MPKRIEDIWDLIKDIRLSGELEPSENPRLISIVRIIEIIINLP